MMNNKIIETVKEKFFNFPPHAPADFLLGIYSDASIPRGGLVLKDLFSKSKFKINSGFLSAYAISSPEY